jgi:bifunctional pyridoxal-dependent enzyme with beta-cystathionase and maltose regulon repressor activities
MFGEECSGYERINLACARATLQEALERIERALHTASSTPRR